MSQLSVWLSQHYDALKDFAGPVAQVIAAAAAGSVAYYLGKSQAQSARSQAETAKRNWQTANEKVVLDLFERRFAILLAVREVVAEVVTSGAINGNRKMAFFRDIGQTPFLFGPEVAQYVEELGKAIDTVDFANRMEASAPNSGSRSKWLEDRQVAFNKVEAF